MSKYHFTVEDRIAIIQRMYQDHGFNIEDICLRLRYPKEFVEYIIKKHNLVYGQKSWSY